MNKEIEQEIREHWFKDHVATLTKHGDLEVLEWKKPGSSFYYCRYVFDGGKMYISGDIGEAVFCLTWRANVHSFDIGISYFVEKMAAYSGDKRDFNSEKAVKRLREWLNELKEEEIQYSHNEMRDFFESARGCSQKWEWVELIHEKDDFISELEPDYWEWMYDCGDEIPIRVYGYLLGLKMASEQFQEVKEKNENH